MKTDHQSLRTSGPGFANPTPEGLSVNSRGCARHAHTPGTGTRKACHPGGVVQSSERLEGLVPGEPLRGSGPLRRESGGVARASLHPRLFTVNPAGVRPWEPSDHWISLRLRRSPLAPVLPGRETTCTLQAARIFAKIDPENSSSTTDGHGLTRIGKEISKTEVHPVDEAPSTGFDPCLSAFIRAFSVPTAVAGLIPALIANRLRISESAVAARGGRRERR